MSHESSAPPVAAIILAAGKSTRMKSKTPKPLHPVCGIPMTQHIINTCREAGVERIIVVVGHEAEKVKTGLGSSVEYALQEVPRGTGDAVRSAESLLKDWTGTVLILAGDVPLLPAEPLQNLITQHHASQAAVTLMTMQMKNPTGYGRIVRNQAGTVQRIVEQKDATPEEREITECNPSIYAFRSPALWSSLAEVKPINAQGEFYFTDTLQILNEQGEKVDALTGVDPQYVLGVNSRVELAEVSAILRQRILHKIMLSGVTLIDPASTYIEAGVQIGQDTVIEPNTYLFGNTVIGEDCVIGSLSRIESSKIGDRVRIIASQIVDSVLENDVKVGPFANLRPKTHLCDNVKIGDFVETKNVKFGVKAQASHLSYIGDAEIGAGTNIGAGTITCNYDGYNKHKTTIGENCFIGSGSTLIAPVEIGDEVLVAAGTTVTKSVDAGDMVIARTPQEVKKGWASARRAKKLAEKAAKSGG